MNAVPRPGSTPAFSLTEILTATAILAVLFTIMFGILQQTSRGWQAANRKVEASQVARMALEQIASDLEFAVAVATNATLPNANVAANPAVLATNKAYAFGMVHVDGAAGTVTTNASCTPPNDQIFVVTPDPASLGSGEADLGEAGYLPIRAVRTASNLKQGRYYLIRHWILPGNTGYDFLANASGWETTPTTLAGTSRRQAFVDNCLRFNVEFFYTNSTGLVATNGWGRPTITGTGATATVTWSNNPPGVAGLPRAAEITLSVLDDRSAERLARILPGGLPEEELAKIPDQLDQIANEAVQATLREGITTFRRQVTFRNGQP